ncbi:MAG: DUF4856 domain-containing protein [Bacteroidota bacterium]
MTNSIKFLSLLFLLSSALVFTACEEEDTDPEYEVPSTYNFENVSYQGQIDRIAMLKEMKTYLATSRQQGTALDADRLKAMYANEEGAGFSQEYTKQLKSKTAESEIADFEALIDEVVAASQSTVEGAEGVSGVIVSTNNPAKQYLIGEDGLDHAQLIEKGLMGACLYFQATSVYMGADRMNVDNEEVEPGKGTAMEHHWDEAWGYFGAPIDFPTNTDGVLFWADYSNKRNAVLESNQPVMEAFLKGRAAISNKDLEARDEAITAAREQLELVSVASALHYLNSSLANFGDAALFGHGLSEAIGFTYSLKFNEGKKITNSQIDELLVLQGGSADFAEMNLYNVTAADLQSAKAKLAEWYDLKDKADQF